MKALSSTLTPIPYTYGRAQENKQVVQISVELVMQMVFFFVLVEQYKHFLQNQEF